MQGHNSQHTNQSQSQIRIKLVDALMSLIDSDLSVQSKVLILVNYFEKWMVWLEGESGIQMSSYYGAIQFFSTQYELSSAFRRALHLIRKSILIKQDINSLELKVNNLDCFLRAFSGSMFDVLDGTDEFKNADFGFIDDANESIKYWSIVEFECHEVDGRTIKGFAYELSEDKLQLELRKEKAGRLFWDQLEEIEEQFDLPTTVNLTNVQLDAEGHLSCNGFILLPDFLVDITSIANCFHPKLKHHQNYFTHKLLPSPKSDALLVGNIVNDLLDNLIRRPDIHLSDCFEDLFQKYGLALSLKNDEETRDILSKLSFHFLNLKQAILIDLKKMKLETSLVYLEPTFYSVDHGLQGRLDIYFESTDGYSGRSAIIELKSGKPFMANEHGLSVSHYVQTILYDLLTRVQARRNTRHENFILYSSLNQDRLKYAPTSAALCQEALAWRNELIKFETKLAGLTAEDDLIEALELDASKLRGYSKRDVLNVIATYRQLDEFEKAYYNLFVAFLSREYHRGKVGHWQSDRLLGQSMLWQAPLELKEKSFSILTGLEIEDNRADHQNPTILLKKSELTQKICHLREGDIVVLYPNDVGSRPDTFQLTKSKISNIDRGHVEIKLRAPQQNSSFFRSYKYWCLEPDFLDSSFRQSFHSLFFWASAKKECRLKWLGRMEPEVPSVLSEIKTTDDLSLSQGQVVQEAINAKDYYLIWGPPGSGKTSRVLASLATEIHSNKEQNLMIAAYTNRAVDEICLVLEEKGIDFIRIGSNLSVLERLENYLLQNKLKKYKKRGDVKELLTRTRVIVGTIASIHGKPELFQYKHFDRLIIDEASQILEPYLLSFLCRIPRAILIGDHKQLPAVVLQDKRQSRIDNQKLTKAGFVDCRNALFDRLFHQLQMNNWSWAYGCLWEQGRMHHDICQFVSAQFYGRRLKANSSLEHLFEPLKFDKDVKVTYDSLRLNRLIFLSSKSEQGMELSFEKKNETEARMVGELLQDLYNLYGEGFIENGRVGVITPFRAQIACIQNHLNNDLEIDLSNITIDTVERYQGGARDVIIYSTCIRSLNQLSQIQSVDHAGMDRKLNVVLSRAREQIIVLGQKEALKDSGPYEAFIEVASV